MKKTTVIILLIFFLVRPANAKIESETFLSNDFKTSEIKNVLLTPILLDSPIPSNEPFFKEKVSQRWLELVNTAKENFTFLIKTPNDVVERHHFVKGISETEESSHEELLETALELSEQYVNAILKATVIQSNYSKIRHPQEIIWRSRRERRRVRVKGEWHYVMVPVRYQEIKPAWDQTFINVTIKVELLDSKTDKLIYGISAVSRATAGVFTPLPSLTTEVCDVLEYCVKRINLNEK